MVITDGSKSYTVFTYKCGSLEWSGSFNNAVIGYNMHGYFMNHSLSAQNNAANISCLQNHTTPWSNLVYQIGDREDDLQRAREDCMRRYIDDQNSFTDIALRRSFRERCPCSLAQASSDTRFQVDLTRSSPSTNVSCYTQKYQSFLFGSGQLCCYDLRYQLFNMNTCSDKGVQQSVKFSCFNSVHRIMVLC